MKFLFPAAGVLLVALVTGCAFAPPSEPVGVAHPAASSADTTSLATLRRLEGDPGAANPSATPPAAEDHTHHHHNHHEQHQHQHQHHHGHGGGT